MHEQTPENTALTVGERTEGEAALSFRGQVASLLQGVIDKSNADVMGEVVSAIEAASQPQRTTAPVITPDTVERTEDGGMREVNPAPAYGTRARLAAPQSHLYARMSPEVQAWRNEETDFWMAQWLRGCYDPASRGVNRQAQRVAEARLAQIFGYDHEADVREHKAYERSMEQFERADTLLGAAGANFALSAGTGGPLVPRPIEALLMIERDRVAKMRRFAQIYNMNRQQHEIPTAGSMSASMTGEGGTGNQGEPTFGAVPLVAKKGAVRAVASVEMLEDSAFNLVQIYATRAGAAFGVLEDDQFFKDGNGSGNNISARLAIGTVVSLSLNTLDYTAMLAIYYAVPQQYRQMAVWFAPSFVLQGLSGVRDATNGRPLYQGLADSPGPITDDPTAVGTILRRPVYEVPLPETANSAEIWFGDPRQAYAVGSRRGVTTTASEHVLFREDKIEWKFTARFDGNNQDAGASAGADDVGTFANT